MNASARSRDLALLAALLVRACYDLLGHALVALPVLSAVAASGIAQFPEPGQRLFEQGGLLLLDALFHQQGGLLQSLRPAGVLLALVTLGSCVPEYWLLGVLARRQGAAPAPTAPALARLGVLALCTSLLRTLLVFVPAMLGAWLLPRLVPGVDERLPLVGALAFLLLAEPLRVLVSLGHDQIAVAAVCGGMPLSAALGQAWHGTRQHGLRLLLRFAAVYPFNARVLSSALAWAISVSGASGTLRWAAAAFALLLGTALRGWWLAWLTPKRSCTP